MLATDRSRIILNPKLASKSEAPESLDYVEVVASRDESSRGRHKRDSLRVKVICSSPAILCALMIPLCALVIRPVAELGIDDDWGYIKSAQVLAQTGHVVYNGAATPMLGWALYLAAIFVKLFGFYFAVVRSFTVLIAILTAFLMQRTLVRAGIREWNATIGTLTLCYRLCFCLLPSDS